MFDRTIEKGELLPCIKCCIEAEIHDTSLREEQEAKLVINTINDNRQLPARLRIIAYSCNSDIGLLFIYRHHSTLIYAPVAVLNRE